MSSRRRRMAVLAHPDNESLEAGTLTSIRIAPIRARRSCKWRCASEGSVPMLAGRLVP